MINEIFEKYLTIFLNYFFLYFYLYIFGKFIFTKLKKFTNEKKDTTNLLYTKSEYLYPLIGIVLLGNILLIINFFYPLKNSLILLTLIFLISISSLDISIKRIKAFLKYENFFSYFVIPGILIISTFDTAYSFDAGYYSIPNQMWIRESNLIIGTVNIFWELGMLSITEYLSAVLWFENSFFFLHLLNIYFVHFFYLFIKENILKKHDESFKNISLFLIVFSIFDNFGFGGGRNGFLYIEGVTKQDVVVGILFWFISIVIIKKIIDKNISDFEILIISLLTLFVYEIKVSSVFVFLLYAVLLLSLLKSKLISLKRIVKINYIFLLLISIWFLKSLLTTSCFVFPLDFTCLNIFDWYVEDSTLGYEILVKSQSQVYNFSTPFKNWLLQTSSFEIRKQVFQNFIFSLVILLLIKIIFFKSKSQKKFITTICILYIVINLIFLFLFGPVARYFIGICLVIISMLGLYSGEPKFHISKTTIYLLLLFSILLLVRSTSYMSLISNEELKIFDPRSNKELAFVLTSNDWYKPQSESMQCWAKKLCDPDGDVVVFKKFGIFKIAYKP